MPGTLLKTEEVATALNLSRTAVFRDIQSGRIKAERYGWTLLVDPKEIERVKKADWYKRRMRILHRD
jgi:transcriptional antiterminator